MKLCWLVPDDQGGGVISVAQDFCEAIAQCGFDVTLLLVLAPSNPISQARNFRVDSLNLQGLAQETPIALLEWLHHHPQDILFLNGCEQADAAIAFLPNTLYCLYVVHDTAHRYWKTALIEEAHLDGVVAVSHQVAQQFQSRLQDPQKLTTIHNGCRFPEDLPMDHSRGNDIIFLGGEKPIKGAFDTLEVWQKLITLGFQGRLHWFGSLSPAFQAKIAMLPESDRIILYGQTDRNQIFSIAATAKIILMLSRVEPFGMATIEAMSMGCVPIAWDIQTGTQEIITQPHTGIFVPLGQPKRVAQKILDVCENYAVLADPVIAHARTHFNATVMAKQYQTLIHQLITHLPRQRSHAGQTPALYQPPIRRFQLLPSFIRQGLRNWVGRSPRLGYWLRDVRGF